MVPVLSKILIILPLGCIILLIAAILITEWQDVEVVSLGHHYSCGLFAYSRIGTGHSTYSSSSFMEISDFTKTIQALLCTAVGVNSLGLALASHAAFNGMRIFYIVLCAIFISSCALSGGGIGVFIWNDWKNNLLVDILYAGKTINPDLIKLTTGYSHFIALVAFILDLIVAFLCLYHCSRLPAKNTQLDQRNQKGPVKMAGRMMEGNRESNYGHGGNVKSSKKSNALGFVGKGLGAAAKFGISNELGMELPEGIEVSDISHAAQMAGRMMEGNRESNYGHGGKVKSSKKSNALGFVGKGLGAAAKFGISNELGMELPEGVEVSDISDAAKMAGRMVEGNRESNDGHGGKAKSSKKSKVLGFLGKGLGAAAKFGISNELGMELPEGVEVSDISHAAKMAGRMMGGNGESNDGHGGKAKSSKKSKALGFLGKGLGAAAKFGISNELGMELPEGVEVSDIADAAKMAGRMVEGNRESNDGHGGKVKSSKKSKVLGFLGKGLGAVAKFGISNELGMELPEGVEVSELDMELPDMNISDMF